MIRSVVALCLSAIALGTAFPAAQVTGDAPLGEPAAIVDLATDEGVRLVQGEWRYRDARIVPAVHRVPNVTPAGRTHRTFDISPRPGAAEFDISTWPVIAPASLTDRRSNGLLAFAWYHLTVTIPPAVGTFDTAGSTVVFEIVVDDYAEVWVNGRLPVVLGQSGGSLVRGFNAPNRVVLTTDARAGERFNVAVFAANGPLSRPPANFIWVRSATLDFHPPATRHRRSAGDVQRHDVRLDAIVGHDVPIEKVASGFEFTEGPVWIPEGYLLFSDPNNNVIYRWSHDSQVTVYRTKSGYTGLDVGRYRQPGSNGLTIDSEGRLTIAEHGNRRITRLEKNGAITVLADRYKGKRLNSPNDLVYKSDGSLYFTDPSFGLPDVDEDPAREQPVNGVYRVANGDVQLLVSDLKGPNGIAFSPDERYLYVGNWDVARKVVMRYDVRADGTLGRGEAFFDLTGQPGEEAIDGVKVDQRGNVYVSGPGGVWIVSPNGQALGTIRPDELPANFAWGDEDGRTLYMTARSGLYRIRLNVPGVRPATSLAAN